MKNINIIIAVLLIINKISDSITKNVDKESIKNAPVNFNVKINPIIKVSAGANQTSHMAIPKVQFNLKAASETFTKNLKTLNGWTQSNKLLIGISITSAIYLGSLYKIIKLRYLIKDPECWSHWKSNLTLETLLAIPQKELTEELITDINRRNYNQKDPINFLDPLIMFINQTDNQLKNLKKFISNMTIIKRIHLANLYFINDSEILIAQERVQRLTYFKNLFANWMSDYRKQHLFNLKTIDSTAKG